MSRNCLFRAESLKKSYKRECIVKDVSITLSRGEIVGLLGPNGAGKTTCFYMISGLIPLDGGEVFIGDQNISFLPPYRRAAYGLAYLPQEDSVFRSLSAADNIRAVLELFDFKSIEIEKKVAWILSELSLTEVAHRKAHLLSGGERRRVEIGRALSINPSFILLDEPFAGVDPIAVQEMKSLCRQLSHMNIGILITDHNVRETLHICDRAYIMNKGSVLISGTPADIVQSPEAKRVYLGESFQL